MKTQPVFDWAFDWLSLPEELSLSVMVVNLERWHQPVQRVSYKWLTCHFSLVSESLFVCGLKGSNWHEGRRFWNIPDVSSFDAFICPVSLAWLIMILISVSVCGGQVGFVWCLCWLFEYWYKIKDGMVYIKVCLWSRVAFGGSGVCVWVYHRGCTESGQC